jgi:hypothetical protein
MAIFMASITHIIENNDIMDFNRGAIDAKEDRIEFIQNLIKILKTA